MSNPGSSSFLECKSMSDWARSLRLAMVQNLYDQGELNLDEARDVLCSNLSPNDPTTFYDDSAQLTLRDEDK